MKQVKILFALVILIAFSTVESKVKVLQIDPKKGPQGNCASSDCKTRNLHGKFMYTVKRDGKLVQSSEPDIDHSGVRPQSGNRIPEITIEGDGFHKWVQKTGGALVRLLRATYAESGRKCEDNKIGECANGICWAACNDCYGMCVTAAKLPYKKTTCDDWAEHWCRRQTTCISECTKTM